MNFDPNDSLEERAKRVLERHARLIKRRIIRVFSWITGISIGSLVLIVIGSLAAVAIFVRTETFQNRLRDKILDVAHERLNAILTFDSAEVYIFRLHPTITFHGLHFDQPASNTSAEVDQVSVGISVFTTIPALFFRQLHLASIEVDGLSYTLKSLRNLERFGKLTRPKPNFVRNAFSTSVDNISLHDSEIAVQLAADERLPEGLEAQIQIEDMNVDIGTFETEFSGSLEVNNLKTSKRGPFSFSVALERGFHSQDNTRFTELSVWKDQSRIEAGGEIRRWSNPLIDIRGTLDSELSNFLGARGISGELSSNFHLQGLWNSPEGDGVLKAEHLRVKRKTWQKVAGQWKLKFPDIELKSMKWTDQDESEEISGNVSLTNNSDSSFEVKLQNADLGKYLELAGPKLSRWTGLTSGKVHYDGAIFPDLNGKFNYDLTVNNYQIITFRKQTHILQVKEVKLKGDGNLSPGIVGSSSIHLSVGDSDWNGTANWTRQDFNLVWDCNFKGSYFGEFFLRHLSALGTIHGSLKGPWAKLVMDVEPKLAKFTLNGRDISHLQGHLILSDAVLSAAPLNADELVLSGGIHFIPEVPDEFSNFRFYVKGLKLESFTDFFRLHDTWLKNATGTVIGDGALRGPLEHPIGSGLFRLDDWSLTQDHTKGRHMEARWAIAAGEGYFDNFELRLAPDAASLRGEFSLDSNGLVDFNLDGTKVRLGDWLYLLGEGFGIQGLFDVAIDYQRSVPALKAKLRAYDTTVGGVSQPDSEFDLNWLGDRMDYSGKIFGDSLDIVGVSVQSPKSRETELKVNLNKFNLFGAIPEMARSRIEIPVSGKGKWNLSQKRSDNNPSTMLSGLIHDPGSSTGKFDILPSAVMRGSVEVERIDSFSVSYDGVQREWKIHPVRIRSEKNDLELKGSFKTVDQFNLAFDGTFDLRVASAFSATLSRSEGVAEVHGVLQEDGFHGTIELREGVFGFSSTNIVVRNVEASIQSQGANLQLTSFKADLKDGSVTGQGRLKMKEARIESGEISLDLLNTLLQPEKGISLRASGPLILRIENFQGELGGKISITEGYFRRRIEARANLLKIFEKEELEYKPLEEEEPAWRFWKLNLQMQTAQPFEVQNNIVDGTATFNLLIGGTFREPRIGGSINILHGQFTFNNRKFNLTAGSILFNDPVSNVPSYDISAEAEVSDYTVFIQLKGGPGEQRVTYKSNPQLSEKDILSLLSFGIPNSTLQLSYADTQNSGTSAEYAGISLATGAIQDKIEGKLASDLGIKRFYLTPAFFQDMGRTDLQLTLGTDIIPNRLELNYSDFVTAPRGGHRVELDYKVNRHFSLIGAWRDVLDQEQSNDFGGDLRFRFEIE